MSFSPKTKKAIPWIMSVRLSIYDDDDSTRFFLYRSSVVNDKQATTGIDVNEINYSVLSTIRLGTTV